MENQNIHHDKDPLPKNMVPNQNPKPVPQKDRQKSLGSLDNKDDVKRDSKLEKSDVKADRKSDNK
ncbi:hypothetical protein FUA48_13465 [Flavobacterium alkalisoli]|uniref:Uncharacterized protein n=1 Tax=Flavobacterium alkalisoli TaxID=2602769 RepID=A0A5B9FUH7_9FLAO|nr:hypothetical protein [Flavobacterium alkalisoli]QEE50544.1 hypothetical protein FUA48_13465 [Flavobacterium alkalisoli]